ncbi:MAG: cytochrome P450 [Acidimicrobiales bacterium]
MAATTQTDQLPHLSTLDAVRFVRDVGAPLIGRGVIIRRPRILRALDLLDADRRAVALMQDLSQRYGAGPVVVPIPGRPIVVVLDPADVHRVLDRTPEPFHPATSEKRAALGHFQPEGVLATRGPEREERRRYNEAILETENPVHSLGERIRTVVDEEARWITASTHDDGLLDWDRFSRGWFRVVRRVILGDRARGDTELTDTLDHLRGDANWAFLAPRRHGRRDRFFEHLQEVLDRAEPGSLAALMASRPASDDVVPVQQVPQWLFASGPAGMATFRACALLATHVDQRDRALAEVTAGSGELPLLSGAILESLRLWPTTPAILRELTEDHRWENGTASAGTSVLIFATFFHRHPHVPAADGFLPERWLDDHDAGDWPLIPFSGGPGMCPGRNLVLLMASTMLASLHARLSLSLGAPDAMEPGRLPATLDPFSLRFRATIPAQA